MNKQSGFTLIEVMVVVAIVAILAAIAYPSYIDYIRKGRLEDARATVVDNIKMMERYYGAARTFECKSNYAANVGTSCLSADKFNPDITNNPNANKYNFAITTQNNHANYIIAAIPKDGVYSNKVLESEQLVLMYHSGSASYAKCTKAGMETFSKDNASSNDGCTAL